MIICCYDGISYLTISIVLHREDAVEPTAQLDYMGQMAFSTHSEIFSGVSKS